jgi:DHA1 family purine base/nucleoside efflux pump-like MFS transporter
VALGAFLGAGVVDHFSVQLLPWLGAALVLGGAGCGWWSARLPNTQDND